MPYCKRQSVRNWRLPCVKKWYSYWSDAAAGRRSGRAQCSAHSSTGCAPTSALTRWCPTRACGRSSWALATSTPSWASKLLRPAFLPGKQQSKDDSFKRKGRGLDVRRLLLRIGVQVIEICLAIRQMDAKPYQNTMFSPAPSLDVMVLRLGSDGETL